MDARTQMFSDVIITAVEGGTGYWAQAVDYRWSEDNSMPASVELIDITEQGGKHTKLDVVSVANAMFRVAYDHKFSVRPQYRADILLALASLDAGEIDSDLADVIAQAAAFGEIVYG